MYVQTEVFRGKRYRKVSPLSLQKAGSSSPSLFSLVWIILFKKSMCACICTEAEKQTMKSPGW